MLPAEPRSTGCVDIPTCVKKNAGRRPPAAPRTAAAHCPPPRRQARSGVSTSLPRADVHAHSGALLRKIRERGGRGAESTDSRGRGRKSRFSPRRRPRASAVHAQGDGHGTSRDITIPSPAEQSPAGRKGAPASGLRAPTSQGNTPAAAAAPRDPSSSDWAPSVRRLGLGGVGEEAVAVGNRWRQEREAGRRQLHLSTAATYLHRCDSAPRLRKRHFTAAPRAGSQGWRWVICTRARYRCDLYPPPTAARVTLHRTASRVEPAPRLVGSIRTQSNGGVGNE